MEPDHGTGVVHIDGDVLKYQIGWACQKTEYTHIGTGDTFLGKTAAKNWFKEEIGGDWNDDDWSKEDIIEPFENCVFLLNLKISEIITMSDKDSCVTHLSPSTNFRYEIATVRPYKGNRPPNKPYHADAIVEWLKTNHDYVLGDNVEADDTMGQAQTTETCIATTDKDLNMIPGMHYNFNTTDLYYNDEIGADEFFLTQLISGDSVDNIVGIPKYGTKKAQKVVESFQGDHVGLIEEIRALYEDHYPGEGEAVMKEMAALLWILRSGETPESAGWRRLLNVK